MDTSNIIRIIIVVVLLFLSAFFSSAETALTTVNKIKIRSLMDEGNKKAGYVFDIINNQKKMLSAILIGNNVVNISASAVTTTLAIDLFGSVGAGIATGVLTIAVLIFGEITPKTAATLHNEKISLIYAPIIKFIMTIFTPLIFIVDILSTGVMRICGLKTDGAAAAITEAELRTFVQASHEDGVIENDEKQIINNVFDFGDTQAKDVMIPRIDMTAADIDSTYEEILELFRQTQYTRLPIYENDPDNVVGILNIKDLIIKKTDSDFVLKNILREPYFTFEYKNTSQLFKDMQQKSTSIAIVLNEYGSTAGMITTEDLIEEIVGEIRDEYDFDETEPFVEIAPNTYRVNGTYKLDDINDRLKTKLYSDDNESIAGFITEQLDRIPDTGESLYVDNIHIIVEKAPSNRIESVIIKMSKKTDA